MVAASVAAGTDGRPPLDSPAYDHVVAGRRGGEDVPATALTGGGSSQIGPVGAMRARDVSRPSDEEIAAAEELVQVSFRPRFRPRPPSGQPDGNGGGSPDAS